MSQQSPIEYSDIQALARFGHGRLKEAQFLLLNVIDADAARQWLRDAPVSSAATTRPAPDQALQIAFTAEGLRALGVDEAVLDGFSDEFITGMSGDPSRSRRLGDVAANAPDKWTWGGTPETEPHLLLMLYAKTGELAAWSKTLQGEEFGQAFKVLNKLTTTDTNSVEPFGFADGISQPDIDWERKQKSGIHERDRFSNLLCLGEVLLGYPNEYGDYTTRPLINAADPQARMLPAAEDQPNLRDLGRNGSYLVMRQLHQDVPGFWQFVDQQADGDAEQREQLAAAMVGRQRDGTPLVDPVETPIEGIKIGGSAARLNQFDFDDDPHGQRCPIGSHIRRANPRTGDFPPGVTGLLSRLIRILGFHRRYPGDDLIASTRFHRLVRRGRVYGTQLTPDKAVSSKPSRAKRGLHFVCLVANISRQFEFVQNAWSMGPKFGGVQNESDPLLGNRQPLGNGDSTNHFSQPDAHGVARCIHGMPQFITVQGGAYFFMPGLRALSYIASARPTGAGDKS